MTRNLFKAVLILSLFTASAGAFATCPKGSTKPYPACLIPPVVTPPVTPPVVVTPKQDQHQQQGQQQGQAQSSNNTNKNDVNSTNLNANNLSNKNDVRNTNVNANISNNSNKNTTTSNANAASEANSASSSVATGGSSRSASGVAGSGNSKSASGVADSGNSSSDNAVSVDTSDRSTNSYSNRSSFVVMSDLPANAMTSVASSMLNSQSETTCGYLQAKVRTPVYQYITKRKRVVVGYDEDIVPYTDANGVRQDFRVDYGTDGAMRISGHQMYKDAAVIGNASNFQMGAQGGNSSAFGGIGFGSGSGQQQIGQHVMLRDCLIAVVPAKAAVVVAPVKVAPVVKRRAARRPSTNCKTVTTQVCKA